MYREWKKTEFPKEYYIWIWEQQHWEVDQEIDGKMGWERMEEAPENGKESLNSAHANGRKEGRNLHCYDRCKDCFCRCDSKLEISVMLRKWWFWFLIICCTLLLFVYSLMFVWANQFSVTLHLVIFMPIRQKATVNLKRMAGGREPLWQVSDPMSQGKSSEGASLPAYQISCLSWNPKLCHDHICRSHLYLLWS